MLNSRKNAIIWDIWARKNSEKGTKIKIFWMNKSRSDFADKSTLGIKIRNIKCLLE